METDEHIIERRRKEMEQAFSPGWMERAEVFREYDADGNLIDGMRETLERVAREV